jgi:hypothetical protein
MIWTVPKEFLNYPKWIWAKEVNILRWFLPSRRFFNPPNQRRLYFHLLRT